MRYAYAACEVRLWWSGESGGLGCFALGVPGVEAFAAFGGFRALANFGFEEDMGRGFLDEGFGVRTEGSGCGVGHGV